MAGEQTRRDFLGRGGGVLAAAAVQAIGSRAWAQASNQLRIGVVGCGGRGSGAVKDALNADPGTRVVALADVFDNRAQACAKSLRDDAKFAGRVDLPADRIVIGLDAYKACIDACDVVILATPPYFRGAHLEYAVEQGKHAFVEKPVATDGPGIRQCLAAAEKAKEKKLSLVSGLCWRYSPPIVETMKRVTGGEIGQIVSMESNYCSGGVWDPPVKREECANDLEFQLKNWYYYLWISGDHIVEQAVHSIDKMGWAMGDQPPLRCRATGGRQIRTDPRYGNIWDHFAITYEWPNNVRGYHNCRHWRNTPGEVNDYFWGTKGFCNIFGKTLYDLDGKVTWRYEGPDTSMYVAEHAALFKAIRANEPRNDGVYMCYSNLLAIMGRNAAYTGMPVTWEQALNSKWSLGPDTLAWDAAMPAATVPQPGVTRLT
ncbi:MAG: Gfo/Idh/MocA family oxidoreductase [Fimbriimonadaceae bacterium]|nr:Gfo/Idh/MocA family oxidoreductase [Fimbriimonadaceae bacterium]